MTTIRVNRENGLITGFTVDGHSGYAKHGADIVCAAVTSAVRLTECLLNDELRLNALSVVKDGNISLTLDSTTASDKAAQAAMSAFCRLCKEISNEYPKNVQVMEENRNA